MQNLTDDKIKITRRIALEKYEFYEVHYTTTLEDFEDAVFEVEACVQIVRNQMKEPSPGISPTKSTSPYEDLLLWDGENKVRLIGFLKEKDKWIEINTYLKGLGFTWTKDGADSRWER